MYLNSETEKISASLAFRLVFEAHTIGLVFSDNIYIHVVYKYTKIAKLFFI